MGTVNPFSLAMAATFSAVSPALASWASTAAFAKEKGLTVPIVLDPGGRTADRFGNDVTTTTVVIDGNGVLRYFGRFREGDRAYAEEALKAVLAGKEVAVKTTAPEG